MNDKIKISEELAAALESVKKHDWPGNIVRRHITGGPWLGEAKPINGLSTDSLIKALYFGYGVVPHFKAGETIKFYDLSRGEYIYGDYIETTGRYVWAFWNGKNKKTCIRESIVEKCTPEEIKTEKERRQWAQIGRKPGEFRDGDFAFAGHSGYHSNESLTLKNWYKKGKLEGFYPAESFIDFGDGEAAE